MKLQNKYNSSFKSSFEKQFKDKDGFYIKKLEELDYQLLLNKPYLNTCHVLIFVTKGSLTQKVDGIQSQLLKGSICVIEKGHIHEYSEATGTKGYLVRYKNEFIPAGGASYKTTFYASLKGYLTDDFNDAIISTEEMDRCVNILSQLETEFEGISNYTVDKGIVQHLLIALILILERRARMIKKGRVANTKGNDKVIFHGYLDILEKHFLEQHSMTFYAGELGVSRRKLSEIIKKFQKKTAKRLHVERVMLEAKRLLAYSNLSLKQIAYQLGFEHAPYFSNKFKEEFGVTPNQYRIQQQAKSTVIK